MVNIQPIVLFYTKGIKVCNNTRFLIFCVFFFYKSVEGGDCAVEKTDRRDRIRKKAVHDAMVKLLTEKKLSEISIVELTALADINRKTFYNHYADLYAVIDEIEDELVDGLRELLMMNLPENLEEHSVSADRMERLAAEIAVPFFTTLIQGLKDNSNYSVILSNCEGHCHIMQKISGMEKSLFLQYIDRSVENLEQLDYYTTFIAGGTAAVISLWFDGGLQTPVEELAGFFSRIISIRSE